MPFFEFTTRREDTSSTENLRRLWMAFHNPPPSSLCTRSSFHFELLGEFPTPT